MPNGEATPPPLLRRLRSLLAGGRGHAVAALGLRLSAAGLAYLLQIVLARALGTADYGTFSIAWNLLTIGGFLATFGFSEIAVRFLAQYHEQQEYALARGFLRVGLLATLAGALVVGAFGVLLLPVVARAYGPLGASLLGAGLLSLPFFALTDYFEGVARSQGWTIRALFPPYVLRQGLIVLILLGMLASMGTLKPSEAMLAAVLATVLASVFHGFLISGELASTLPDTAPPRYDLTAWRAAAWPTLLSDFALLAKLNIDLIVLGVFVEPRVVGLYFAATRIASLLGLLEFAVKAGMGHRFARAAQEAEATRALAQVYREARRLSFWPGLMATLALGLATPFILRLFGPEFPEANALALLLMAATALRLLIGPADEALAMAGHPTLVWQANGLGALVTALGTALLAPFLAATGAALATLVGSLLASGLMLHYLGSHLGFSPLSASESTP